MKRRTLVSSVLMVLVAFGILRWLIHQTVPWIVDDLESLTTEG